jgi:hypothetical protein
MSIRDLRYHQYGYLGASYFGPMENKNEQQKHFNRFVGL